MRINCEILDLRAFLAVLDAGGFEKAAHRLNMSQPTISRRIRLLEEALNAILFERSTRKVSLSRIGAQFEPLARRIVHDFESSIASLSISGNADSRLVRVAAIPTAACRFLPRVIEKFARDYPGVRVRILDLPGPAALECVASGEADFGVNFLGATQKDLRFTPLIDDPFVLACHVDHPIAKQQRIKWSDLRELSLIISQASGNRALIDHALSRSNLQLNWMFEASHLSTSFGIVEAGVAMAVVPRLSVPLNSHPLIASILLECPRVTRTIGLVERFNARLTTASCAFRELLRAEASSFDEI